jgi:hypothetical protein
MSVKLNENSSKSASSNGSEWHSRKRRESKNRNSVSKPRSVKGSEWLLNKPSDRLSSKLLNGNVKKQPERQNNSGTTEL